MRARILYPSRARAKQGDHIIKRFREIQEESEIIGDIRGMGLMVGVEVVKDKETKKAGEEEMNEIKDKSWRKGLLLISCGESTIRIAPPLTINRELVDISLDIIERSIKEVENGK